MERVFVASGGRKRRRRGFTLVLFAMLLFGLFALAALVIDIGMARVAQRQMQTAADSAALEGLRGDPSLSYSVRMTAARKMVANHFDDDLDAISGDNGAFDSNSGQFGAGPLVEFTGGAGDVSLAASQTLTVAPTNPVYKPILLDGTQSASGNFSVALQRGVLTIPEADLYSDGPAVPYLFARGSLANRELIQRGITVRGTGKAEYRNALSVGVSTNGLRGLATFALELSGGTINTTAPYFFLINTAVEMPVVIGRTLPPSTGIPVDSSGYVPVFATLASSSRTCVIGYVDASYNVTTGTATISTADQQNARENASVVLCNNLPTSLTSVEINEIFALNRTLNLSLKAVGSK